MAVTPQPLSLSVTLTRPGREDGLTTTVLFPVVTLAVFAIGASSTFSDVGPPPAAYSPSFLYGIFLLNKKFCVIISLISSSISSES
jgi:hypothetical protein